MVSAACWKAGREQAIRAAEEVLLQGSNLQLWGIYVFVLIATWHPVISCGHMLAMKNTIKMTPASGARSHFCSNCKTVQMQVTIFHQRSAEHVFCSFFYRLRCPFLASVSVILQWKAAVSACILEARLEEERRRLAEEVGQGSGCGLVTDCQ